MIIDYNYKNNNNVMDGVMKGVPKDASQAHIKKAFKKLSVKLHPDKNPDGRDQFVELSNGSLPSTQDITMPLPC